MKTINIRVTCMAMLFVCLLMPDEIAFKELLHKRVIGSSPRHDPG